MTQQPGISARPGIFGGRIAGLDALRAIAVVLVVIYHAAGTLLPGGFIGVDVFFVVSGFLITGLLLREQRTTGSIALARFWMRRARRLLPALVAMVVLTAGVAAVIGGDALVGIRMQVLGALSFSANWLIIGGGHSYAEAMLPQPLTHTWSLAVEEQFYLLWPLILLALLSPGRRRNGALAHVAVAAGLIGLASASWLVVLVSTGADETRAYMGTDSHVFGLMLGAVLAAVASSARAESALAALRARRLARLAAYALALAGFAGLLMVARFGTWDRPDAMAVSILLTAGCTAMLIAAMLVVPEVGRQADRGVIGWVGVRSYGLYLYHWPALVLMSIAVPGIPRGWAAVVALVIAVALAALSYRHLEQPARRFGILGMARRVGRAVRGHSVSVSAVRAQAVVISAVLLTALAVVGLVRPPDTSALDDQLARTQQELRQQLAQHRAGNATSAWPFTPLPGPTPAAEPSPRPSPPPLPPTTNTEPIVPSGDEVTVIGDSVTLASADALQAALPGIVIDAEVSRNLGAVPTIIQSLQAGGMLRQFVVISLATNSTFTAEQLESDIAALGPGHRVVLVTAYGNRSWIPEANAAIAAVAQNRADVVIADWNAVVAQDTTVVGPDGIHPLPQRADAYASVVAQALASLNR